jgi:hypothetical protein
VLIDAVPPWPEWLFGPQTGETAYQQPSPISLPSIVIVRDRKPLAPTHRGQQKHNKTAEQKEYIWDRALQDCETLSDIRHAAGRVGISLREPDLSALACQRLLDLDLEVQDYLSFLSDRKINPAEARNITVVLRAMYSKLKTNKVSTSDPDGLGTKILSIERWLRKEIALGNLSEQELNDILQWCSKLYSKQGTACDASQRAILVVWQGIKESRVLGLKDLEEATILRLVDSAACMYQCKESSILGAEIISNLALGRHVQKTALVAKALLRFTEHFMHGTPKDILMRFRGGRTTGKQAFIFELLESLPETESRAAMATLVLQLLHEVSSLDHRSDRRNQRMRWLECFLVEIGDRRLSKELRTDPKTAMMWIQIERRVFKSDARTMAAYIRSLPSEKARCICLLDYLFLHSISDWVERRGHGAERGHRLIGLRKQAVETIKTARQDIVAAPYLALLAWTKETAPGRLSELITRLMNIGQHLPDPSMLSPIAKYALSVDARLSLNTLYRVISHVTVSNLPQAIHLFFSYSSNRGLHLEQLPRLAVAIIESKDIHTNVLFTLLHRTIYYPSKKTRLRRVRPLRPQTIVFLQFLAYRLSRSREHEPQRALKTVRRIMRMLRLPQQIDLRPGSVSMELYNGYTSSDNFSLSAAVAHASFSRRLLDGVMPPRRITNWALTRLKKTAGPYEAEKVRRLVWRWNRRNVVQAQRRLQRMKSQERKSRTRDEQLRRQRLVRRMIAAGNRGSTSYIRDM